MRGPFYFFAFLAGVSAFMEQGYKEWTACTVCACLFAITGWFIGRKP